MINFIAFHFSDNDFHVSLNDTILNYMIDYKDTMRSKPLNVEWLKEYAIRGMLGFDSLRPLARRLQFEPYDYARYRSYFDKTLNVLLISKMDNLPKNFQGYIVDVHLGNVFYFSY